VTTDSGHKASDPHWMMKPKGRTDYEHRAVHLTALAAKKLVARFYGKPANRSYFLGCSGGGRQALKEMQNYPRDYDGVVAGAPGPYMPLISVRMMYFSLLQKKSPAGALNDADWALYESASNKACDGADGVLDGVVENPLACSFKPRALLCAPGQTSGCLSPAKTDMLETIVAPMPDENGRAMDNGLLPGVRTRPGPPSPLLRAMWGDAVYRDANWNEDTFLRTADLLAVNRVMPELRADRTMIAPFLSAGGKAIIYQGWQDPSVIAGPTVDYYTALAAANGGESALARSVRLFMVPGMYHCARGPGVDQFGGSGQTSTPGDPSRDILWSVIDWVEKARTPQSIEGARLDRGKTVFTRALCAFPNSAKLVGGDPAKASSYQCVRDPLLAARLKSR
jgi:feruloyl esterase